jgi:hypothetical protein
MHVSNLSGIGQRLFKVIEFDENEQLIAEIRKHPFGLFIIYLTGFSVSAMMFVVLVILPTALSGDPLGLGTSLQSARIWAAVAGGILTILAIIMTAVGAYLYQSNVMLVTSEKIAQVLYRTIFDRKISQLSIGDVQDVTVTQKGIFARIFKYGTIVIETAGEQQNYNFTYAPNPYESAKLIVGSHERNLVHHGN